MPKRSELAQVRLTLAEWLRVRDAAKRERKTVSSWLRDMIAGKFTASDADKRNQEKR